MILLATVIFLSVLFSIRKLSTKDRRRITELRNAFLTIKKENEFIERKKSEGSTLLPYEEWLSDNFYLVSDLREGVFSFLSVSSRKKRQKHYEKAFALSRGLLNDLSWNIDENRLKTILISKQSEIGEKELAVLKECMGFWLSVFLAQTLVGDEKKNVEICIQSIRILLNLNWVKMMEEVSLVEKILFKDPSNVYCNMDEESKAYYRFLVSEISEKTEKSEYEIAELAVCMAKEAEINAEKKRHVGFYLLDEGKKILICRANSNIKLKKELKSDTKIRGYCITLFFLACFGSVEFFYLAWILGASIIWSTVIALLAYIPIYVSMKINADRVLLSFLPQKPMLSMEISSVPAEYCSFVVIPALLTNVKQTVNLVQKLERIYHAGNSENLYFAVLGDLKDSESEENAKDAELFAAAINEIKKLNQKYGDHFFYFGRKRSYDKINHKYMGWERKRGAILEFIRLLHGEKTNYMKLSCSLENIPKVKYIICVDSDTEFLKNSAQKLIAAMRHPLNMPEIDKDTGIVTKGYGLLQPSIQTSMDEAEKNGFSRIFSCNGGVDAYSFQSADFYQDFLNSSIFNGKGIFDVDIYWNVLNHAIVEQRILSHDLLEGSFLRTGFIRNVVLTDGHPKNLLSYGKRLHRWTRGDWQLLPYLFATIQTENGNKKKNPLSFLSKYQIFDNLFRSMMFPCMLLLFFVAILASDHGGIAALLAVIWHPLTVMLHEFSAACLSRRLHSKIEREKMYRLFLKQILHVCFVPYFAVKDIDAAIRATARTWITKKKMLEWVTAEEAEHGAKESLSYYFYNMLAQPICGFILLLLAFLFPSKLVWILLLTAVIWSLSPIFVCRLGKTTLHKTKISERDRNFLSEIAQDTWKYFDSLCGTEENFLPPDNFQEQPYQGVAHRTSPTNIGMLFCAYVAAYDFGWIGADESLKRIANTLATVESLEKKDGHLYNWYDTLSLSPLRPRFISTVDNGNFACMLIAVKQAIYEMGGSKELIYRIEKILNDMDFCFLFNNAKQQFSIGYDAEKEELLDSYYDFLASEARQAVFFAIARNQAPDKSWYSLSRRMTKSRGGHALLSWTGTMFEYLMPVLFMPSHKHSLLFESYQNIVKEQICYAKSFGLPIWGISECGFCSFDKELNYQYKALGVPYLALKRDMHRDLVISPYSSCLALCIDTKAAVDNLKSCCSMGVRGKYGMYEAVDFTNGHIGKEHSYRIVKSYMVHHQGMSLIALDNLLHDNIFCRHFFRDAQMRTAKYLLDEPKKMMQHVYICEAPGSPSKDEENAFIVEFEEKIEKIKESPEFFALSNGTAHLIMSSDGTGRFCKDEIQLYRFRSLYPCVENGHFAFIRVQELQNWESLTLAPTFSEHPCKVKFTQGAFCYSRQLGTVSCEMKVSIGEQAAAELREITFINHGKAQQIEFMNYMELTLAKERDDRAHPAFSGLFLQTEYDYENRILFAKRRPRRSDDKTLYTALGISDCEEISVETSRMNWIGRGRKVKNAQAFASSSLSNTTGTVLDAIFSFRAKLRLQSGERKTLRLISVISESKQAAREDCIKYRDFIKFSSNAQAISERMQEEWYYLKINEYEVKMLCKFLTSIMHPELLKSEKKPACIENRQGQEGLWKMGISGDDPILLYHIRNETRDLELLIKALLFLKICNVHFDCVVLQRNSGGYYNEQMRMLDEILIKYNAMYLKNAHGGIFLLDESSLDKKDLLLLQAVAFAELDDGSSVAEQIRFEKREQPDNYRKINEFLEHKKDTEIIDTDLTFFNEYGGFDRGEYVIKLNNGLQTPLPWSHIISNERFGFLVTERGGGYMWDGNSRECKLTPWSNDPILDHLSEIFLLCDTEMNWQSPLKGVIDDGGEYTVRYGLGFCEFSHMAGGNLMTLKQNIVTGEDVKVSNFTIENCTDIEQEYHIYYAVRPLLGVLDNEPYITTWYDEGVMYAKNFYSDENSDKTLFVRSSQQTESYTGDSSEFFDSGANIILPRKQSLNGRTGFLPSSCLGISVKVCVKAKEKRSITFYTGCIKNGNNLVVKGNFTKFQTDDTQKFWREMTSAIEIKTPDTAFDILVNHWLLYQVLACRMYARTAFYQCGGAYGFRDQLQDSLAFLYTQPKITRRQILYHAEQQFKEGDVLHWWHQGEKGEKKGVRTRISDDLLWLSYAVCQYIEITADDTILEEEIPYLEGEELGSEEKESYVMTHSSNKVESLYSHACRSIHRAMTCGVHGLPLIGSGDWNDGMNEIGRDGKGESVWLGWFLAYILKHWIPIAEKKNDVNFVEEMRKYYYDLTWHLNHEAWNGEWFLRAFYDNGIPLGTKESFECQIDLIAQCWATISECGEVEKCKMALDAVRRLLIDEKNQLIRLLYPPFNRSNPSPGYIQGYPEGIRENGGQYTHGALWAVMAFARMGKEGEAYRLFSMLNPINHTRNMSDVQRYKAEPYVLAGDIYTASQSEGRAGWSWYTGAAGWMYRIAIEEILGMKKEGNTVWFEPKTDASWNGFQLEYRFGKSIYQFTLRAVFGKKPTEKIVLKDDGEIHSFLLEYGIENEL